MAKTQAPLFGFGASGKLGDAIVFGRWKGIDVARKYVVPANPDTAAQNTQRGYMTTAVAAWHDLTNTLNALDVAAWNRLAGAQSTARSGFNEFVKRFVNNKVLGGSAGWFFGATAPTLTAAAFIQNIDDSLGGTLVVTLHLGNSKTNFPVTSTDAQVGGLTTFAATNTTYAAGTTVYWYFDTGTGATYKRSGLYSGVLV